MLDIFQGFERAAFPESECTIPNAREPDVTDSDSVYLCVVVDDRFPHNANLEYLRPYTAVDYYNKSMLLYGWACIDTDGYIDHCVHPIRGDHNRVVAWKKIEGREDFCTIFGVTHGR